MKSLKFFPLLCLLASLLLSCDRDATTSVSDGSWTASFRVASSLTDSQLSRATWVRVQASRSGVVVASDSALYTAHSVTLTIPSAGAVDIRLTGYNTSKDTVMWTGTGTIADGVSKPGNVVTLVAGPGYFTDSRDGQSYKYVKIGTQTWMAQNLNYQVDSSWCYGGVASNCSTYGRLYRWSSAMALSSHYDSTTWGGSLPHQGICPSGWHVPSDAEWQTLEVSVGMSAATAATTGWRGTTEGTKLKANSSLWSTNTGTDAYGFSVLPAGNRYYDGTFYGLGYYAYFWSSSEGAASGAWYRYFYYSYANVGRYGDNKSNGFSLRCLEN